MTQLKFSWRRFRRTVRRIVFPLTLLLACSMKVCGGVPESSLPDASSVVRLALVMDPQAAGLQAQLTVRLAGEKTWALVDREQIELFIQEQELAALVSNPDRMARLGRLLDIDGFVHLRSADPAGTDWLVELIEARSGRLLGSETVRVHPANADRAELLGSMVTTFLRRHLAAITAVAPAGRHAVVVLDFATVGDGTDSQATAMRLGAELRARLMERGLSIVDRNLIRSVTREKALKSAGFTDNDRPALALLGAAWLVSGEFHAGAKPSLELSVLNVTRGLNGPKRRFDIELRAGVVRFSPEIVDWLLSVIGSDSGKSAPPLPFEMTIQAEALQPFYRGMARFSGGDYWAAASEFEQASLLNMKFEDACLWEARCYELLGFPHLAGALRRFVRIGLVARGNSAYGRGIPDEGITFLGVVDESRPRQSEKARNLEMLMVNELVRDRQQPIRLADELARLRDEYDQLVGTPDVLGTRWQDAPNLLAGKCIGGTLLSSGTNLSLQLTVLDTLTGERLGDYTLEMPRNEKSWPTDVVRMIAAVRAMKPVAQPPILRNNPELVPVPELTRLVKADDFVRANTALLQLMQADPTNTALWGNRLRRGSDAEDGVQGYVNFALNEEWLARLPVAHPWHAWLELAQIYQFYPWKPNGLLYSDQKRDFFKDLQKFIAEHPDDAPGAFAEYTALLEQIARFPPDELAKRFGGVQSRLDRHAASPGQAALLRVADMARQLRELALIAAGSPDAPRSFPKPKHSYPHHIRPVFHGGGVIDYELLNWWAASEATWFDDSQVDLFQEACAALYIVYGRERDTYVPDPALIKKYPHSYTLLAFVINALHESNYWISFPMRYPLDGKAERAQYRAWVDYAGNELKREILLAKNPGNLVHGELWARTLIHELSLWNLMKEVPDSEFEALRGELSRMLKEAEARCGAYPRTQILADWRTMPRIPPPDMVGRNLPDTVLNLDYIAHQEEEIGRRCWAQHPLLDRSWVRFIHAYPYSAMPLEDLCKIYLRRLPQLEQFMGTGALSYDEQALVMDFALVMYQNNRIQEAERLFRRIVENPASTVVPPETARELRANAAMRLGWVLRAAGRKTEALDAARLALELSGPRQLNVIKRISPDRIDYNRRDYGLVRETTLRLLSELRSADNGTRPDEHILQFTVRTPNIKNAELICHVRVPRGYRPKDGPPHRVLVIVPSLNEGTFAYCAEGSPWAAFADSENMFLLLPQFVCVDEDAEDPARGFHSPQIWSGQALLDALAELRSRYNNIQTDKLLLHGYGGGAQFVHRFALWKPELVSAISAHSAATWTPVDFALGLNPVSVLRGIPCLVTCGAEDDLRINILERLGPSLRWVTFAREAGVPVLWKIWSGEVHNRSTRMERLARAFLSECLRKDGATSSVRWVTDLRDGRCYHADDQQVQRIPPNYLETLPSEDFKKLWNEEQ